MTFNLHQAKYFIRHYATALRRGHGVHSPFAYRLCQDVFYNRDSYYDFKRLAALRQQLLTHTGRLEITDLGAGSKAMKGSSRKVADIAAKGISSRQQCELLYRLANYLNCRRCIELGTSLGLTSLYLGSVNAGARLISIEGSKALSGFAQKLAADNSCNNIEFVNASFADALPGALQSMGGLDLFYIDGNHTYQATLDYFKTALPYAHPQTVFVLDDIYWSPGMTRAWEELRRHPSVSLSIDLFYMGLLFFKEEFREPVSLRLYI